MGVGRALRLLASPLVLALAVGLSLRPLPWHQGVIAGVGGLVAAAVPSAARLVGAAGLAAALAAGPPVGVGVAASVALVLAASARGAPPLDEREATTRRNLAAVVGLALLLGAVLALKQVVAMRALPAASQGVWPALNLGLATAAAAAIAAWLPAPVALQLPEDPRGMSMQTPERPPLMARLVAAVTGPRALALGMVLVGMATAGRLVRLGRMPPMERLVAAQELDALPRVYDRLLVEAAGQPGVLGVLVTAAPGRDEAALAVGWDNALALGWRPARAAGVVVPVARALEAAGRGGEALRLLARHPREGDVDGLRALFERTQGLASGWQGAVLGELVPPGGSLHLELVHDGAVTVEFTAAEALAGVTLSLEGDAWQGPPEVDVALDGGTSHHLALITPIEHELGAVEAGPHRVTIAFVNDKAGPGGDRNVRVTGISGRR